MFVRCINNNGCEDILTIGKVYEVIEREGKRYKIKSDDTRKYHLSSDHFILATDRNCYNCMLFGNTINKCYELPNNKENGCRYFQLKTEGLSDLEKAGIITITKGTSERVKTMKKDTITLQDLFDANACKEGLYWWIKIISGTLTYSQKTVDLAQHFIKLNKPQWIDWLKEHGYQTEDTSEIKQEIEQLKEKIKQLEGKL